LTDFNDTLVMWGLGRKHRVAQSICYAEAVGKTVAKITATNEPDFRSISADFPDKTVLHFTIYARLTGCP
jgi:hypothetical protein